VHDERDVYTEHDGHDEHGRHNEYDKNDEIDQNAINTTSSWYWNDASTKLLLDINTRKSL